MTTYASYERKVDDTIPSSEKSREVTPREATSMEVQAIKDLLKIEEEISELLEQRLKILKSLPKQVPLVGVWSAKDEEGNSSRNTYRTVIVDRPIGGFVYYPPLGLTMHCKTTKKDMALLNLVPLND